MLAKSTILSLGLYAILGFFSPTPEVPAEPSIDSHAVESNTTAAILTERSTGVWLDVYTSGSCDSGWENQPKSGWVWAGQCKNFDSFTYGARAGKNDQGWPS